MTKNIILILLILITGASANKRALKRLSAAKEFIAQGNYLEAIPQLERALEKNWNTPTGEESAVLLAEAQMRQDSVALAKEMIAKFNVYYVNSVYENRVNLLDAKIAVQENDFYRGSQQLMKILFLEKSNYLYDQAREVMLKVLKSQVLHEEELLRLTSEFPVDNEVVGTMIFQLAQIYESQEKYTLARNYLERIIHQFPGHPLSEKANAKKEVLQDKGAGTASLLIVTPLSGDYARLGQYVVQGAILAVEQHNATNKVQLSYRVIDSKAYPAETIEKVSHAMLEDNIVGVVGPVMSPTAAALGAWLSQRYPHIPMITPTATDVGIAALGTNIFQINTSPSYLAQSIARFSVNCMAHREIAILSPDTDYGHLMAQNFKNIVEKFGGTVLFEEYYEEGKADYRSNFDVLRLKKYNLDRERDYIGGAIDSIGLEEDEQQKWLQDSTITFDALFIAASDPEDASVLATQAFYNKVKADLLGSSGWYSTITLKKGKQYVEGAYFSTPLIDHDENSEWTMFRKAYMDRWGAYPDKDRVSGLTYNAARFMLWGIKSGGTDVVKTMRSAKTVKGVYGKMKFNAAEGYNDGRTILKIENARFFTAKKCKDF